MIQDRITPAHAGTTPVRNGEEKQAEDHPRLRGYYTQMLLEMAARLGSPPLARVLPAKGIVCELPPRITPACAGTTHNLETNINIFWDHPRLRGYYVVANFFFWHTIGSPPLTRVLRYTFDSKKAQKRITPAHAGTTRCNFSISKLSRDHPRSRGYYSSRYRYSLKSRGSPPLTRVLQYCASGRWHANRITPAHAGTTLVSVSIGTWV